MNESHDKTNWDALTTMTLWLSIALGLSGLLFARYWLVVAGLVLFAVVALWRPVRPELDERGPPS